MEVKPLVVPNRLYCDQASLTEYYGKFYAEPFEPGFGVTLGNTIRRVLLSSVQGAAPISLRIEGVPHEYSIIDGMKEDIQELVLNLKSVRFKMLGAKGITTIYLDVKGPMKVTAKEFELNEHVEILNSDQHLMTLSRGARVKMEVKVAQGRGYSPAAAHKASEEEEIGLIPLDAAFSPILNVTYRVENARLGQRTDYDRLILEVWSNGSIRPEEAISYAGLIMRDHLSIFIRLEEEQKQVEEYKEEEEAVTPIMELEEKLDKSIEELELSVRSFNCLEAAGIKTIRDLIQKTESDMLKYRNFGRKSLNEIKNILKDMGLSFNMKLDERGLPMNYPLKEKEKEN
jgi:DNA-directed RNA polymerase subunit alpha